MKLVLNVGMAVGLWCSYSSLVGAATVRTVALTRDFPPGTPKVLPADILPLPLVNNLGLSTFNTLQLDPFETQTWSEEPGGLRLLVSGGDSAPLPGEGIQLTAGPVAPANVAGQTLLMSSLSGVGVDSSNDAAVWIEEAGSLQLVAREGDQVPGFADGVVFAGPVPTGIGFVSLGALEINAAGPN